MLLGILETLQSWVESIWIQNAKFIKEIRKIEKEKEEKRKGKKYEMDPGNPSAQNKKEARGPSTHFPNRYPLLSLTDRWDPVVIPELQPRFLPVTEPEPARSSPFNCPLLLARYDASPSAIRSPLPPPNSPLPPVLETPPGRSIPPPESAGPDDDLCQIRRGKKTPHLPL
jgi:hypothetical protein